MRALVFSAPTLVWLLLSAATVLSWWLGTGDGGTSADAVRQATIIVMVLAFIKVRLVLTHFMEVRGAPVTLRLVTDAWVVLVCGVVITMYLRV